MSLNDCSTVAVPIGTAKRVFSRAQWLAWGRGWEWGPPPPPPPKQIFLYETLFLDKGLVP